MLVLRTSNFQGEWGPATITSIVPQTETLLTIVLITIHQKIFSQTKVTETETEISN